MTTPPARIDAMDGLRGWAAVSVAGYHFVWETFGARFPELRNPFVSSLLDGPLAVSIFFVLSGYVLTAGSWGNSDKTRIVRQLVKRYARLMLPVLAASLVVLLLMLAGLTANAAAGQIVGRETWLGSWLSFPPDWSGVLGFSFFGVFLNEQDYGPFLWTMPVELWGSILVLGLCLLEARLHRPAIVLAALAGVFLVVNAPWSGFFFGALIALGHHEGWLARQAPGARTAILAALAFAAVLVLVGLAVWLAGRTIGEQLAVRLLAAILAPVAVLAMCWSRGVAGAFSGPLSRLLGRLSFPLYLLHFPVLVSLTSFLIVGADGVGVLGPATAIGIAALSLAASLVAAAAFLPVEWATARVGRWLERFAEVPRAPAATVLPAE